MAAGEVHEVKRLLEESLSLNGKWNVSETKFTMNEKKKHNENVESAVEQLTGWF